MNTEWLINKRNTRNVTRTHDSLCCVDRRGVRCGDKGRGAGTTAVEAGHGWQAGVDVCGRH